MSYFRNVRDKYDTDFKNTGKKEPNPYYEGYLNEQDKVYINGYDHNTENVVTNFFYNTDIYTERFEQIGFDPLKVDANVLQDEKDIDDYSEEELDAMSMETKVLLAIANSLLEYIESDRNMLITSMIDNLSEKDYNENYKNIWGKEPEE